MYDVSTLTLYVYPLDASILNSDNFDYEMAIDCPINSVLCFVCFDVKWFPS